MTAVLAVEDGWQGMRELSLTLAQAGRPVDVLIKGRVAPDVLGMVTRPPGMRILSVARPWFRWRLLAHCLGLSWGCRPVQVIAQRRDHPSKEQTRQWLERLRWIVPLRIFLFEEGLRGNRLVTLDGRVVDAPSLAAAARGGGG